MNLLYKIKGGIFGLTIGDALGVPYEFESRDALKKRPAQEMMAYGSHNQPAGTWSDDSSLTFCLMESLLNGFDLNDIAQQFASWYDFSHWTPYGRVFDIGMTTRQAIYRIKQGYRAEQCGGTDEHSNGNGSLMRILPMAYYLQNEENCHRRFKMVKDVSSITHGHLRSVLACIIYVDLAIHLLQGKEKSEAYRDIRLFFSKFIKDQQLDPTETVLFSRVIEEDISKLKESSIESSTYVIHSLEAALWAFLTTDNYKDAVLKAVNLGEDTDTIAAITGGLAGIYYGYDNIPELWKYQLARFEDIEDLINRFNLNLRWASTIKK
ncbi:ADP-ribosylglycohydrolase family protein [Leptobacterium flavescens]|uniref:ADP-ribosylglycohydrolase family protein n=1 Tax=Leptobacterium flavescens TaxID=472055 RepID=A0A6P0ULZ8_9FLAO|nr:ADP-ribosylglycohydrolase family protein [Leptobacterium flavescens]NER14265.1 ADP-ribosylglycohydrolase family protein [Leptobacterium flavescens]